MRVICLLGKHTTFDRKNHKIGNLKIALSRGCKVVISDDFIGKMTLKLVNFDSALSPYQFWYNWKMRFLEKSSYEKS